MDRKRNLNIQFISYVVLCENVFESETRDIEIILFYLVWSRVSGLSTVQVKRKDPWESQTHKG